MAESDEKHTTNRADYAADPIVEMTEGYRDGSDPDCPDPGPNRSEAYRHGFANRRDDLRSEPRASAAWLRTEAERLLNQ